MIGSFGDIAFTSSDTKLLTFRDMVKQYAARYAKHDVIGKKPKLEFVGPDLRKASFTIRLDITKGVKPKEVIDSFVALTEQGEAQAFMLGSEFIGMYVIISAEEVAKFYDNRGGLWVAEFKVSIEEYDDE